jgi:uncharacterized SAM-binding protein YcdF (DUF218 family)
VTPIIIFGCAVRRGGIPSPMLRARVEAAAAFGATIDEPLYIPTGGIGRHGPSEARVMQRLLVELGVPDNRIRLEETATDTLSAVRAVGRMIAGHADPIYVATSGFHQPRCIALFRIAGFAARGTSPPPPAKVLFNRWYWRLREAPALPYDAALLFFSRRRERPKP